MKHWSERAALSCSCGHVARSAIAEARHRHNFPLLCKPAKPSKTKPQPKKEPGNG